MELEQRFPITFAKCQEFSKKHKRCEPNIVTTKGITYDKSVIPILTENEVEHFIDLQMKYPETINACFNGLIEILETYENPIKTSKKNKTLKKNPMAQIYSSLTALNEHTNMEQIDKWVLFIKSQNEFSKFF